MMKAGYMMGGAFLVVMVRWAMSDGERGGESDIEVMRVILR